MNATSATNVYPRLAEALAAGAVEDKLVIVATLAADWVDGRLCCGPGIATLPEPGWPANLRLVAPKNLTHRGANSNEGRAALIHAIAHIEFSAINLALDHALRFHDLPDELLGNYCGDWISVAAEEAVHFGLLRGRLRTLGHDYGDFPAHASLWQMAEKTKDDALARMALVPRLLEARGLDATPPIRARFEKIGDGDTARVLDVILRDEIRHVAIGDRWFRYFCDVRGVEPEETYRSLIAEHAAPWPQAPMNEAARRAAGFSEAELTVLVKRGVRA